MQDTALVHRFLSLVEPPLPNDWEVEEHLAAMQEAPASVQDEVLRHVPAIWPVSHSLCYSYLALAGPAFSCLEASQVEGWIASLLDTYEQHGLRQAQQFMLDVEENFLCRLRGEQGLTLAEIKGRLEPYATGLAGRHLELAAATMAGTDSETVFLPGEIALFRNQADDFLLYKFLVTFQVELLAAFTYRLDPADLGLAAPESGLRGFFNSFAAPRLAEDLFTLSEAARVLGRMVKKYPGLMRDAAPLLAELGGRRRLAGGKGAGVLEELALRLHEPGPAFFYHDDRGLLAEAAALLAQPVETVTGSARRVVLLYRLFEKEKEAWENLTPLLFFGRLRPEAEHGVRLQRRKELKERFVQALAARLVEERQKQQREKEKEGLADSEKKESRRAASEEATALLVAGSDPGEKAESQHHAEVAALLALDLEADQEPDNLRALAREITDDLGSLPAEYVSAAHGLAGSGLVGLFGSAGEGQGENLAAALAYPEWDYRRQGFRRDWVALFEKKVVPVRSTFVETTLHTYRGLLRKLKKQFELMRRAERFVRRQRDGDDIDLDAAVESELDRRAGLAPSERVFVRLQRDERDIAVLFLVDMSSSTEGWVGQAIKESLILMAEALEVLGDRYAICGFSGMRRSRAEFFHIKSFSERYDQEARDRIAGIGPREYTRMGPAIRHAATLLAGAEARVRLLITLTDGKPEDYDDYKGEYAVEDTRHALVEARSMGVTPFSITIDRQAHDYMGHLFGETSFIFIDEVRRLPARLPAIYRTLTS